VFRQAAYLNAYKLIANDYTKGVTMKHVIRGVIFTAGFLLSSIRAVASPDVDHMSDTEVCEYAARMSSALEIIDHYQLCERQDAQCVRTEMARYGVSYDDKETLRKRLVILIGSFH